VLKKLIGFFVLLPVGIALIVLSVANRNEVTLLIDPFDPENPAVAVTLPFFVFLFAAFIFGLVAGGILVWWRQGRHRAEARFQRAEARRWRELAEANRRNPGASLPTAANDRAA
jgi:hypothetical protein